ncbi:BtrH N-terminal domain-containing protein [Cryptosporangium japonicum]|uniref:BtrH N-terminal domain-containing protein n=1 Tax=Cryptosporangium japonicum TaxID=80872 RepID=A0ABN0U199_9ACTN
MIHCETTALGVLLRHEGVELSEPMTFGLGEGLGFVYWDARNLDVPFLGGRTKPLEITRTLTARLGLDLHVQQTRSPRAAWRTVVAGLGSGRPVGLQLDSYHLEYFPIKVHFPGHVAAIHGYDDTHAYLIDTAGEVTTSLDSLAAARPARNLSFTIAGTARPDLGAAIRGAVRRNAQTFLTPPIANVGYRGIATAARRIPRAGGDLSTVAMLMEHGGTGGALFRNLYRDFLAESVTIVDDHRLRRGHELFAAIAPRWTAVAARLADGAVAEAADLLAALAEQEREAMETLAGVDAG